MIAKIHSAIPYGFSSRLVEVEGDTNLGLPAFNIVGMGGKTIFEARERVRSAIANSNLTFPSKKVTINLAPADLVKEGTYLDLPIALSILALADQIKPSDVENCLFVGELSLDGATKPVKGIINIIEIAKASHLKTVYIPQANLAQASLIQGIEILGAASLKDLFLHLKGFRTNLLKKPIYRENVVNSTNEILSTDSQNVIFTTDKSNVVKNNFKSASSSTKNVAKITTKNLPSNPVVNSTNTGEILPTTSNIVVKNTKLHLQQISTTDTSLSNFANSGQFPFVKNTKPPSDHEMIYLDQILHQSLAKRAITIAVAGHHNILLTGPPGTGKTMLAKAAYSLLPPPTPEEIVSITKIYSLFSNSDNIVNYRPFRSPHHTASPTSIIGGGNDLIPGEISLAHHGILFLDEFPEFPRNVIEALRQPLEDKFVNITRTHGRTTYPANFMLIATMNPCPCGYLNDPNHPCTCTENQIRQYRKRISGPILDRFDIITEVGRLKDHHFPPVDRTKNYPEHQKIQHQIFQAAALQLSRDPAKPHFNSDIPSSQISQINLSPKAQQLLRSAAEKLNLSTRAYLKCLKVARTIADLEVSPSIETPHIAEALTFRQQEA